MKKAIILKAPGTNNDYETFRALNDSGAQANIVHINQLASGEEKLDDYAILVIPGGFSYGDDLGAGKVFSIFMEHRFRDSIVRFIEAGKIVLGICNGFQVLVKSKLLPDINTKQKVTLSFNDSGKFICRWIRLKPNRDTFWFKGLPEEIELPIAHAEGKFTALEEAAQEIKENGLVALSYLDNPNGSMLDIAGITNQQGNVLGLMPHPERFFDAFNHPASRNRKVEPWGRKIFRNIVEHA